MSSHKPLKEPKNEVGIELWDSDKELEMKSKAETASTLDTIDAEAPCFVGKLEDTPLFLRDNEYIKGGYRINFNSVKRILRSMFMCHNELTNIWSHFLGVLLFLTLIVYIAVTLSPEEMLRKYRLDVIMGNMKEGNVGNNASNYVENV